ncbi:hypothetical protein NCS52_00807100 [Fusarium sp. LHS14.1]|nr:hypothetical protein NCS52_00807100 [Fusarium sp. LHS14.1]
MPSLTEYFGHTITNFGPLTTTFTAPSSCATETTDRVFFANATNLAMQWGFPKCKGGYVGDCFPSGSAYDDYVTTYWERPIQQWYPYFSPGLVCPQGWSTVGTFALAGNTSSANADGVFTKDPHDGFPRRGVQPWLSPEELWSNALKPSETLVYCCPSGYTGVVGGSCNSALGPHEEFDYKSVCRAAYPLDALTTVYTVEGTPVTEGVFSVASVTDEFITMTAAITDVEEEFWGDWVVATMYPAVVLVYQESDVAKAKEQGGNEGEDKDKNKSADDDNAASALSARGIVPVLAVAVGLLAGAGLLMPW